MAEPYPFSSAGIGSASSFPKLTPETQAAELLAQRGSHLKSMRERIGLVGIFMLGAFLRIFGAWEPLPFYTSDEANFVWPAMALSQNQMNPYASGAGWFGHPGHLLMYLLFISFGAYYVVGSVLGEFPDLASFKNTFLFDPIGFYRIGRLQSVVYGLIAIAGVYVIAKKCFGAKIALLAAFLLAVSPLHIARSQIIRTDILVTCLVTLTMVCCVAILRRAHPRFYLWAGASLGLGVATKYPAALAAAPLLFAHFASLRAVGRGFFDARTGWLLGAGVCAIAALFVGAPFVLLDLSKSIELFRYQASFSNPASLSGSPLQNYWWYLAEGFHEAHGVIGQVLALVGFGALLLKRSYESALLVLFPVIFLLCIGFLKGGFVHWILPIVPLTSIFAAVGLVKILDVSSARMSWLKSTTALVLVVILSAVEPVSQVMARNIQKLQKHYSLIANEWVEQHLPPGAIVAVEEYAPPVSTKKYSVLIAPGSGYLQQIPAHRESETNIHGSKWRHALGNLQDFSTLEQYKVQYAIVSLTNYMFFQRDSGKYQKEIAFYNTLFQKGILVYEVASNIKGQGPVRIYQLKPS